MRGARYCGGTTILALSTQMAWPMWRLVAPMIRHCEERSNEAPPYDWIASLRSQ